MLGPEHLYVTTLVTVCALVAVRDSICAFVQGIHISTKYERVGKDFTKYEATDNT